MGDVRVTVERNIGMLLFCRRKETVSPVFDMAGVPMAEEDTVPADLQHKLGFAYTVEEGVTVAAHRDNSGIGSFPLQYIEMATAVPQKENRAALRMHADRFDRGAGIAVQIGEY